LQYMQPTALRSKVIAREDCLPCHDGVMDPRYREQVAICPGNRADWQPQNRSTLGFAKGCILMLATRNVTMAELDYI